MPPERSKIVRATGITKKFGGGSGALPVLADVTLEIAEGESVAIVGPSGCGKTTFLKIIAGIEKQDAGEIAWTADGKSVCLAFAFQHLALFPWRTAEGNVRFPIEAKKKGGDASHSSERVSKMIAAFGLQGFEKYYPSQLSGGMRQRLALARAMVTNPRMLILDEPFGALDVVARLELQDLILSMRADDRISILMVTHDLHEAVRLCERVIVFSQRPGRIMGEIETQQWSRDERMRVSPAQTAPYVDKLHLMLRASQR